MIDLKIDTEAVLKKCVGMLAKIDHFKRVDIGTGLSDFQVDDMHRHRPFTMRSRARGRAVTKVRPHSLYEMEHSRRATRRIVRYIKSKAKRRRKQAPRFYMHTSVRPILRAEMYSALDTRMTNLFIEKIKW
jgi:hypothetical protein